MLQTDLKIKHQTYITNTHTIKNTRWPAVRNYTGTRTHLRQMYIVLAKVKVEYVIYNVLPRMLYVLEAINNIESFPT